MRMLTEAEAVKLWCPWLSARGSTAEPYAHCIGAECMMWQWLHQPNFKTYIPDTWTAVDGVSPEPPRPEHVPATWTWQQPSDGDPPCWMESQAENDARRKGYCGLAAPP